MAHKQHHLAAILFFNACSNLSGRSCIYLYVTPLRALLNPAEQNNMDEAIVAQRCAGGNAKAQKELFMRHNDAMLVLCMRYITNKEDAREAMMDGFLAAYKNINSFEWRGDGSLGAWLRKVMVNQCLTKLRKRTLRFEAADITDQQYEHGRQEEITGRLSAKEIITMIHSLPDGCRTVFNLHIFEQMGHAEIGKLLGISENTSKSQLHRARTLLKEKIVQKEKTVV